MKTILVALAAMYATASVASGQALSVERVIQIAVETGAAEQEFGGADVQVKGNEIFILDHMNAEVKVFGHDGRLLRRFGRKGQGPGEFQFPSTLLLGDSTVTVFDPPMARRVTYTLSGRHLETVRIPDELATFDSFIPLRFGHWLAGRTGMMIPGQLVNLAKRPRSEILREGRNYREHNPQIVVLFQKSRADTVFTYDHGRVLVFNPRGGVGGLNAYWGAGGSWSVAGDSMVTFVDALTGIIRIADVTPTGLKERIRVRANVQSEKLSESDWRALAALQEGTRRIDPKAVLLGPTQKAKLGQAVFASDGSVWVPRIDLHSAQQAKVSAVHVIPIDGRRQQVLLVPPGLTIRAVSEDNVYGIRQTDLGAQVVEVWRVVRNRSGEGATPYN